MVLSLASIGKKCRTVCGGGGGGSRDKLERFFNFVSKNIRLTYLYEISFYGNGWLQTNRELSWNDAAQYQM